MMTEIGVVTRHEEGLARVEVPRSAHCEMCSSRELCEQGKGTDPMVLLAENPVNAPVGSSVEVGVPKGAVARGAVLVYGLPVGVLVIVLAVAQATGVPEGRGVVAGVICAGVAMLVGGRIAKRGACRPVILRIVPPVRA